MRKLKIMIFAMLSIFITLGCASQDKTNSKQTPIYNFNLTKDFETFDSIRYKNLPNKKTTYGIEYLSDGTEIIMQDYESQKSYSEPPPPILTLD